MERESFNEDVDIEFREKLSELVKQYGIKEACFAGKKNDTFIGYFCLDEPSKENLIKCGFSASMLYQAVRERILQEMSKVL